MNNEFKDWYDEYEHDLYNYPEEAMQAAWNASSNVTLHKTEDWHEDYGDCLFFHFESFNEPPLVLCSTPISSDFECDGEDYWTHYVQLNFNSLFIQAGAEKQ